jgi:phosphonate transport system ATP-binding protein
MKSILSVKNLIKTYPHRVEALKGVSFDIEPGEFVAVIGLSGSGKSSLLKCINHLVAPTSGEIIFHGQDLTRIKGESLLALRKKIAMIFQSFNLISRHSAISNTLMGALSDTSTFKSLFGLFSKAQIAQAHEYLKLVGIDDKIHVRASQLSGGQQQRVAIARALMQKPEILLADEPVASLDPNTAHVVMKYLKFVNEKFGVTIVCNLHFLSLVRDYSDRVIGLRDGRVVFIGKPSEITDDIYRSIYGDGTRAVDLR